MNRPIQNGMLLFGISVFLANANGSDDRSRTMAAGPSHDEVRKRIFADLLPSIDPVNEPKLVETWARHPASLDAAIACLALAKPEVTELLQAVRQDSPTAVIAMMQRLMLDEFWLTNLSTFIGRELVRQNLHDEATEVFRMAMPEQLVDPAAYYFYLAVCQFQLQLKEEALLSLDRLGRIANLPERYRATADSMKETMSKLKRETLDGISHDMRDLERRFRLGRTDQKVQEIEKDVLARLDKLIEDLERQQQQQQSQAGGNPSDSPAPDSQPYDANGDGKADSKTLRNNDPWGNLPEKQRERAMQTIGREFPPHYRAATEEYFRRLAKQKRGQ